MANNNQKAHVDVSLNGQSAEAELIQLQKRALELKKEIEELKNTPLADPKLIKQLEGDYRGVRKELSKTKRETVDVKAVMNNLSGATLRQLELAYRKVSNQMKNTARNSVEFKRLEASQKRLKSEIDKTNISFRAQQSFVSRLAGGFSKYSGIITAALASWAGVIFSAKSAIDAYNALDEKFADVMKTTRLSRQEVEALNNELAKINTRTSQQELLDLARVAGKLGITSQQEILGFVKASDQIAVALAEDLGGDIEDTVNQLGKLVEIFGISDEFGMEKSLLKIGSTINSLGAIGTANEAYLVEFGKRLGGIAPMANISIDAIMGMAATLDELGQTSEVSSTAIGKVIAQMFTKTADYARIAGMGIDEFTELLNTDANAAFIKVLEGAKGSAGGFSELANNLTELGLDGARSVGVFAVLANNLDLLQERQAYANEEFEKGTSLTDEFNIKNNTATAKVEKARKEFQKMAIDLGQKLQPAYASIISKGSLLLKSLMAIVDIVIKYRNVIMPMTVALLGYFAAVKAIAIFEKMSAQNTFLAIAAKKLYNTVITVLRLNLKKATIEQEALNKAGKANVWGLVAAGVSAAATFLIQYVNRMKEAGSTSKQIADATAQTTSEFSQQRTELQQLLSIAKDNNISLAERQEAIKKLNEISPEYLGNITLENINTASTTVSINKYVEALKNKAREQALSSITSEKFAKIMELEVKKTQEYWDSQSRSWQYIHGNYNKYSRELNQEINDLNKDIEDLMQMFNKYAYTTQDALDPAIVEKITAIEDAWVIAGDHINNTLDDRSAALASLNSLLDGHVDTLTMENILWSSSSDAIRKYIDELKYAGDASQTPIGSTKEINGQMYKWDGQEWILIQPGPTSPDVPDNKDADNKQKQLEKDIWEMAQFEESMLIDSGQFYSDYILGRKNIDESYFSWKKRTTIEKDAELLAEYEEHQKAIFDSQIKYAKQAEDEYSRNLEMQHAKGELTDQQYEDEKLNLVYASLLNELTLRQTFGQDTIDIKQQIADAEFNIELNNQKRINEEKQKAIDDYQKKAEKYQDIAAEMGEAVGKIMGDNSKSTVEKQKEMAKELLKISLTALRNALSIAIAEAYFKEVATKGLLGLVTGTALTAALGIAYGVAMSKIEGWQAGGGTGNGPSDEIAGVVHRKEYVIPEAGTSNPSLSRIISIIEAARKANKLKSVDFNTLAQLPALQSGGFSNSSQSNYNSSVPNYSANKPDDKMLAILNTIASKLDKFDKLDKLENINANINYDKLTLAESKRNDAFDKAKLKS